MPRRTRTQRQRRLEACAQRERDREVRRLAVQLRTLWRQYEATAAVDGGQDGYRDPQLMGGSREAA